MIRLAATLMAAILWLGPSLAAGVHESTADPFARAWALRASVSTGDTLEVLQLADTSARSGTSSRASGTPLAIAGNTPWRVEAGSEQRSDVQQPLSYEDPTGSLMATGIFAEAHASEGSAGVRAGLASLSGSGFSLADELLTWEEQEELMGTWVETNTALFETLNNLSRALEPLLSLAGLEPPHFRPAAAMGLIDFGRVEAVSAAAETASGPGLLSARGTAALDELQLMGGFIEIRGVSAEATSESAGGVDVRSAESSIRNIRIAGLEVVADSAGVRVASNDLLSRTLIQPLLDHALNLLAGAGLTIRVADVAESGDLRQAVAFELELSLAGSALNVSVGYAEAAASSTPSFGFEEVPAATVGAPSPPQPPARTVPDAVAEAEAPAPTAPRPEVGELTPAPPDEAGARRLPEAVARAMRTAYLLIAVVGGLLGALAVPMALTARRAPVATRARKEVTG